MERLLGPTAFAPCCACDGVVGCVVFVRRSAFPCVVCEWRGVEKLFVRNTPSFPKVTWELVLKRAEVALREKEKG